MPAFLRFSFSTKVTFALSLGLGLLLVLGAFGFYGVGEFFKAGQEVRRLLQVRGNLELVRRDIEHAESVQFRYQLTGDAADQGEFTELTSRVLREIENLRGVLLAPDQKDRLDQLKRTAQTRFDVLAEAMLKRGSGGTGTALLLSERSAEAGREVQYIVDAIGERERQMMREGGERVENLVRQLFTLALWSGAIAVALLIWTIFVINRYERDRRRAESDLANARERLAFALEGSNSAAWDWDLPRNEIYLSAGWPQILGAEARETTVTPAALLALVHPDDVSRVQSTIKGALIGVTADYHEEHRVRRMDGNWTWIRSRGRVVRRDGSGGALRITGINHDVSEIKRAEQALRASEGELRLITDSVPAFIGYADSSENLLFCNKALATFVGARPEDLIGRPLRQLYGEDVYRVLQPYAQRALRGEKVQFQRRQTTRDGGAIELDVTYIPRHGALGEVAGFYSLSTDITELKRLDRMKSEFVSTVSHELRTPLTSIRGSLGILAGGVAGPLSDKVRGFIDIAKDNCERLIRLINDILDMEKIESGKMTFQLQVLDLMELIEQTVRANAGFASQHGVRLQIVSPRSGTKVHADGDRLAQVLTNLISNACKFSPAQSSVDIAVSGHGGRIRVDVIDHGPGISETFRKRIFQKFSQEDSSDMRQKGGTGLGLSISKAIVEGLGGEIGFDTEAGRGSTFYFYLPQWREEAAPPAAPLVRARLLVCEGDAEAGRRLQIMADKAGYDADICPGAAEVGSLLRERRYIAMTLDLNFSDQDALALMREVRANPATAGFPVIALCADGEEGKLKAGSGYFRVVDWLSKPIDEKRLFADLQSVQRAVARPRILHVEDDADVRNVVATIARDIADFEAAGSVAEARARLEREKFDLVLLDLGLPDGSGWELLPLINGLVPSVRVVIFSAQDADHGNAILPYAFLVKSQTSEQRLIEVIQEAVKTVA